MCQVRNRAPRAWSRKGRGVGEPYAGRRGAPGPSLVCEGEGGKWGSCSESQGFSQPYATRTPWFRRPVVSTGFLDPVLLSPLLKTGPCKRTGNGRDLGLLSQDQVIELFVLGMWYLWTFQKLGHEARELCQIRSFSYCCILKIEVSTDGYIP